MTRVLLTRARDDAERTAEKLRRMGVAPVISPVIEIAATGAKIPDAAFDAALATSARAIAYAGNDLSKLASLPFYVVGARTKRAAEAHGLQVAASAPDVAALVSRLRKAFAPLPVGEGAAARFLYLAGRDRRDELEAFLREGGHDVSTIEVYEARAARALTDAAIATLKSDEDAVVLHYSARSAKIFLELANAAPLSLRHAGALHLALSEDVARSLRDAGCANVRVAAEPNEDSLLQLLRR